MPDGTAPVLGCDAAFDPVIQAVSRRWPALTPREREIIHHLAQGRSTAEISCHLYLSKSAVKFHVTNLLRKTGARSTRQLLAMVIEALAGG